QVAADGKALEVPGDVLADVAAPAGLVLVELHEQLGVPTQHPGDLAQVGHDAHVGAGEGGRQVGEEPGAAQAAASDDHPVAAGVLDHGHRVVGRPDVAV